MRRVISPAVDGRGELGRRGEAVAEEFLRACRYTIVARNYRCRAGEIDLVALDGDMLVFVEVRSRRGAVAGTPL
ncbi:MAG: YraN family protein, partial [Deltaproteobacteria bacterium]